MAGDDELREKRRNKKGGVFQCNEMGIALGVASVLALFIFMALSRVSTEPEAMAVRPGIYRTSAPTFGRSHSLPSSTNTEQDVNAVQAMIAEEQGEDEGDPMAVEGPTATPPPAGDDPMAVEGPTATPPPVGTSAPTIAAPAPPDVPAGGGTTKNQPWPICCGTQPPTSNPRLVNIFSPSAVKLIADQEKERVALKQELTQKFGSWCDNKKMDATLYHCWTKSEQKDPATLAPGERSKDGEYIPQCTALDEHKENHCYDNQSNWDRARHEMCSKQREKLKKEIHVPDDIMQYIDLVKLEAGEVTMSPGNPSGELSFNPAAVRDHFFKAQAALIVYAQGATPFTNLKDSADDFRPSPVDAEYESYIDALAKRFAALFVRGDPLIIAAAGDSTLAGADNCFYDNWLLTLERQLKPLFAAAGVQVQTRNCGHNGGFGAFDQLACAEAMLGEDATIAITHFPFVRPREVYEDVPYELFLRRSLASGIIPHISNAFDGNVQGGVKPLLFPYTKYGVGFGPRSFGPYPYEKLGAFDYWPSIGKSNWGRVGDGKCHTESTRSGSAAVLARNWHPGPAGHQVRADTFAFHYMTAATQALTMIETDLKQSGGKLAPLRAKYRGRDAVKDAVKTWPQVPVTCDECKNPNTRWADDVRKASTQKPDKNPGCDPLCANDGSDTHFPKCLVRYGPFFGRNWSDWLVQDQSPGTVIAPDDKPMADPRKWSDFNGSWSRVGSWEPVRPLSQCTHLDRVVNLHMGTTAATVFKVPKGTMQKGIVSACVQCGGEKLPDGKHPWDADVAPTVAVQEGDGGKAVPVQLTWMGNQRTLELTGLDCFTIGGNPLPTNKDIYVHIDCTKVGKGLSDKMWNMDIAGTISWFLTS
eukprot:m.184527 g.184527  ORF g.184527 m.184527 type:complete len:871 (+) comp16164_c0_seq1:95-2707(+)